MTSTDIDAVIEALTAELRAVRAELEELKAGRPSGSASHPATPSADTIAAPASAPVSRRRLLAAAGGVAAGAAVGSAALTATPAAALNNDTIKVAATTSATAGAPVRTVVDYSKATSNPLGYFVVTDGTDLTTPPAFPSAIAGEAHANMQTGVYGLSDRVDGNGVIGIATTTSGPSGYGVWGQTVSGAGVVGSSTAVTGYDFKAAGQGRILVTNHTLAGPPSSGSYLLGELIRDLVGDWFVCYKSGTPGLWRKLGGATTAGALHVVDPTRVYDSRLPGAAGPLSGGGSRVINVANGINIDTGAVIAPNLVPVGATAIAYNLTIDHAAGAGFLFVGPGTVTAVGASTINWSVNTPSLANGTLVKLDNQRQVKVFAGGGGAADFIIDITGYYL